MTAQQLPIRTLGPLYDSWLECCIFPTLSANVGLWEDLQEVKLVSTLGERGP